MPDHDSVRETAKGFFALLRDFAKLRSQPAYDIAQYEAHLMLTNVPAAADCFVHCRDGEDASTSDDWLWIEKRPEVDCPLPAALLQPWIASRHPYSDEQPPVLRDALPVPPVPADEAGHAQETWPAVLPERLEDHPEIREQFAAYLQNQWEPWATEHRAWRQRYDVYSQLFTIHRDLERRSEDIELLLGLGLLCWRAPDGRRIRRHILTLPAELRFNAKTGRITVGPSLAADVPAQLETDMLDALQQSSRLSELVQAEDESLRDDLWGDALTGVLRSAANELGGAKGSYDESISPPDSITEDLLIVRSPAIILRRRSTGKPVQRFEAILEQLEKDGPIPRCIGLLSGYTENVRSDAAAASGEAENVSSVDAEAALFPLATNEAQRSIVDRLQQRDGLLVQGPPGTGKSHTIANLICHLAAHGKRVLVTAQTPRALAVLRNKLPVEVQPLCLSLLGEDHKALDDLKDGVTEIMRRQEISEAVIQQRVERHTAELARLQAAYAANDRAMCERRAIETRAVTVADGAYAGTTQEIAQVLDRERARFEWLRDVPSEPACPASLKAELLEFLDLLVTIDAERTAEVKQDLPAMDAVIDTAQLRRWFDAERAAAQHADEKGTDVVDAFRALEQVDAESLSEIGSHLKRLSSAVRQTLGRPSSWVANAVHDVLADDDAPWKTRHELTQDIFRRVRPLLHRVESTTIDAPADVSRAKLKADAEDLRTYIQGGGKVTFFTRLLNRDVKRTHYLTTSVHVDGRVCDSVTPLSSLIDLIDVEQRTTSIWSHWAGVIEREEGSIQLQIARLTELDEGLSAVLALDPLMRTAREAMIASDAPILPDWKNVETVEACWQTIDALVARKTAEEAHERIEQLQQSLQVHMDRASSHPVSGALAGAIDRRDTKAYDEHRSTLESLHADAARLRRRTHLRTELAAQCPLLIADIESAEVPVSTWSERIEHVEAAWAHHVAASQVLALEQGESLDTLARRERLIRDDRSQITAQLAADRAWLSCRLSPKHQQHLNAWQIANKKIGKGTGKYAARNRRVAQRNLVECREAIPAWVMPMYRIFEQIDPRPEMFDVIIIDEASQCSLDALVLLYLGRQVVVVGDDEQISPTAIVKHDELHELVRRHLPGNRLAEVFQPDTSLFELGKIWFGDAIMLREHFRCVPEIIRFSDELCYRNLIPLKQCPVERLDPLISRFVDGGFRTGTGSATINGPEIRAVVEAVCACCEDPRYDGKTMGVISLLGSAQARKIESILHDRLPPEVIEERRLVCGDAYSFQGDERDVMFLSLVVATVDDTGERIRAVAQTRHTTQQRFNVAASRAKEQMWLFHSVTLDDLLNPDDLRRRLLEFFVNPYERDAWVGEHSDSEIRIAASTRSQITDRPPAPFDSWFEVDVYLELRDQYFEVVPQFEFGGYRIDMVVRDGARQVAVECDGDHWHGPERFEEDLARQRQLERVGWTFLRIRGSEFYLDREGTMRRIIDELQRLGIHRRVQPELQLPALDQVEAGAAEPAQVADESASQVDEQLDHTSEEQRDVAAENSIEASAEIRREVARLIQRSKNGGITVTQMQYSLETERRAIELSIGKLLDEGVVRQQSGRGEACYVWCG